MTMAIYHVMTQDAATFGVCAAGKRDALELVTSRLRDDEHDTLPISCSRVAVPGPTWEYGTVLRYT